MDGTCNLPDEKHSAKPEENVYMFRKRETAQVTIPAGMLPEHFDALRKAGIAFPLFVQVTLPKGWRYVSSHETHGADRGSGADKVWGSIVDTKGRERAITYCCVGPEEQYMTLALPRFTYDSESNVEDATTKIKVLDRNNSDSGELVFMTRSYHEAEQAVADAKAWLNEHYPDWNDASAYWD